MPPNLRDADAAFPGGGEMGALMRALDWSKTPLGPVAGWPQSLLTAVSTCLDCAFPILIWWGPELVMLYNDEYRQILGSEKHPAALGAAGRAVWPELWDVISPMLGQVVTAGQATRSRDLMLLMNRHGYAEETYFSFSYSPIRDETGGVGGVFTPVIETTEKVIGERRLRTLRELSAAAGSAGVEAAISAALAVLSRNDRDVPFALIYARADDGQGFRLVGAAGVDPGGPAAPTVASAGDDLPWPLREALAGGQAMLVDAPGRLDLPFAADRPHPERPHPERALVMPITPAGRDAASVVLIAGINPLRPLDQEHRAFFDLVAGQIGQSLADALALEEERRRAAALAELDRAKTQFFSNVSHEFRTPLTLMLGPRAARLANPALSGDAVREPVRTAHRNGMRLLKLVNTLLDFSRIEAGRIEARFAPVDLGAYTAEVASAFRSLFDQAGLDFKVEGFPLDQPVYIDRDLWEKVVLNLVSNAFKFTLEGRVTVTVRPAAGGAGAELVVADTGVGIPEAALPRLFERFYRVENVQGRSFEGSGIGLALVRELVALHGGVIAVDSREGAGATFVIRLPFGTAHLPADRVREADAPEADDSRRAVFVEESSGWLEPAPSASLAGDHVGGDRGAGDHRAGGARRRVLLADDNADMRHYVARLLLAEGYEVETANDGEAALRLARLHPPDLVLADVMMPKRDGLALLRALRADAATAGAPVILLSARAGEAAKIEGLASGADDYLVKPFSARELLARIQAGIRLAEARRAADLVREADAVRLRELNETLERRVSEGLAERKILADIVDGTDAFVQVVDMDYRWMAINRASADEFERIFGKRPQAGENMLRLLADHPDHLAAVKAVWSRALSGEEFTQIDEFGDPGRDRRWYEMKFNVLRDLYGRQIGAFQFVYDVSDRLRDQARLAEAEAALRQAQKLEAMGQLTGGVAHDFNNLLTPILGALDMLQRRKVGDAREQRLLSGALQSGERAKTLVQRLLAFARRQPLQPSPIDVRSVIEGMADLIASTIGPNIRILLDLPAALPPAKADANQLEMAILNLSVNARDAMEQGGGTLKISARAEVVAPESDVKLPPGAYVRVCVEDTGAGMTKEVAAKAIEPFFSTKGIGRGTGLGLSMVHGLASQLGGGLEIDSEPGRGTAVALWLPRSEQPLPRAIADLAPPAAPAPGAGRALLVDDEDLVRLCAADMLAELGFEVVEATSAEEALRLLASGSRVDVLVTDHLMSGMNGAALAREVCRRWPQIPTVIVSGYADAEGLDPDLLRLNKPFRQGELAKVMAEAMRGASA